jgi:hypothetical protein
VNFILHHVNSLLHRAALNLFGMSLFAFTLCVVLPFFLIIVALGTASVGAYALGAGGISDEEDTVVLVSEKDFHCLHQAPKEPRTTRTQSLKSNRRNFDLGSQG